MKRKYLIPINVAERKLTWMFHAGWAAGANARQLPGVRVTPGGQTDVDELFRAEGFRGHLSEELGAEYECDLELRHYGRVIHKGEEIVMFTSAHAQLSKDSAVARLLETDGRHKALTVEIQLRQRTLDARLACPMPGEPTVGDLLKLASSWDSPSRKPLDTNQTSNAPRDATTEPAPAPPATMDEELHPDENEDRSDALENTLELAELSPENPPSRALLRAWLRLPEPQHVDADLEETQRDAMLSEAAVQSWMSYVEYMLASHGRGSGLLNVDPVEPPAALHEPLRHLLMEIGYLPPSAESINQKFGTAISTEISREAPEGESAPNRQATVVYTFIRDFRVARWVREQANGICECCEKPAPFVDAAGKPYLEVHHVLGLADGGPDTIDNAVAICPNCHRLLHFAHDRNAHVHSLRRRISRLNGTNAG
jgi:5-methylcytosine-specific restriction endonuclease McrA